MDELATKLLASSPGKPSTNVRKIDHLFHDRPDVLDAIRTLHARKYSGAHIARLISQHSGQPISAEAVRGWLDAQKQGE